MPSKKEAIIYNVILIIVQLVLYVPFLAPVLIYDDWQIVNRSIFHGLDWFSTDQSRPFLDTFHKLIFTSFGLNVRAEYLIQIFLLLVVIVSLYWLLQYLFRNSFLAFAIALAYAIYPADFTRMWFTMTDFLVLWLFIFIYIALLYYFSKSGKPFALVGALISFTVPLFLYEAQLGLACAISIVIAVIVQKINWKRRLLLLTPLPIAGLFAIWRVFVIPAIGISDSYLGFFVTNPVVLLGRVIKGWGVLFWVWSRLIAGVFGLNNNKLISIWIIPVVILFGFLGYLLSRFGKNINNPLSNEERRAQFKRYLLYMLIGFVILSAGYIPYSSVMPPNTDTLGSRTNAYALPGAAILLVCSLSLIGLYFTNSEKRTRWIVIGALVPLMLVGLANGWEVQRQARIAWNKQTIIWNSLFKTVPDFKNGTSVYLVMPEFHPMGYLERAPLMDEWETQNALQVLYNNPTLSAYIIFLDDQREPQFQRTTLRPEGINFPGQKQLVPYANAVFVYFDPKTSQMSVLKDLKGSMGLSFALSNYHPDEGISTSPRPDINRYRYLVTPFTVNDNNPVPVFK